MYVPENMAEVRQCFGRGADELVLKTCRWYLLKSYVQYSRSSVHIACLSIEFPLADTCQVGLHGAQSPADGLTAAAAQDAYTRGKLRSDASVSGHTGKLHRHPGLISSEVSSQIRGQTVLGKLPRYQSHVKVWMTLSGCLRGHKSPGKLHLYRGQFACIRAYSGNGAGSEPLYKTKTGYYEILEVSPTATQAQIKTAYYKQSFIYHPDRNSGSDEATVRFSEISEANVVLGNKALRKKYDRGLLTLSDLTTIRRPSGREPPGGPARQQSRRSAVSADQQQGVFDFDSFFKSHYSDQLQRQRELRVRREEMQRNKEENMSHKKMERMMEFGVGALLVTALALLLSLRKP